MLFLKAEDYKIFGLVFEGVYLLALDALRTMYVFTSWLFWFEFWIHIPSFPWVDGFVEGIIPYKLTFSKNVSFFAKSIVYSNAPYKEFSPNRVLLGLLHHCGRQLAVLLHSISAEFLAGTPSSAAVLLRAAILA